MNLEGERCSVCGCAELTFGYGFAGGGGIGGYVICLGCDRIIAKQVDVPGESFILPPAGPVEEETE